MNEFVFSFRDKGGQHIARFEGQDENEAFANLQQLYPDAKKIAAFPVDPTLDKILSTIKTVNPAELDELDAHGERTSAMDTLAKIKANAELSQRLKKADAIEQATLKSGEMSQNHWNTLCSSLTPQEKNELYNEFLEDADKNHSDPKNAELEKKFIRHIFGVKEKGKWNGENLTVRDVAKILGISHVRVLAIQKQALAKLMNNIAKMKKYPFKITSAEEAIALLLADNIVNHEQLKLKAKVNGGISFEQALKKMTQMERAQKAAKVAKQRADNKRYREAMAEFRQLEKENNALRDQMGLPRQYQQFYKFFVGQKLGNN